jgi:HSP20 family protein
MAMSFDPFSELDRVAGALLGSRSSAPRFMPVDLYREQDRYVLSADMPGIDPGSVDPSTRTASRLCTTTACSAW